MSRSVKFVFLCLLIGLLTNMACYAVPAYSSKVKVAVEGGEVYIQLCGDESCKYAITEDGYTILRDSIGWLYAEADAEGNAIPSKFRLVHKSKEDNELRKFLRSIEKGLVPSKKWESPHEVSTLFSSRSGGQFDKPQAVVGERRALIILMQFTDKRFSKRTEDFEALFNEVNYKTDGAIGSVYDYYKEMSYGQLELKSDIVGPYTSQYNMAYYGRNSSFGGGDKNPMALFEEALVFAQSEVDFAQYDADNDGYVDNIHIIFAGYGEEAGTSSNAIWSHEMTFQPISVQSLYIDRYSCSPELRGNSGDKITHIGVICHEIGHALGAMDYYDTDYGKNGEYYGTGEWDIMAQGSWNGNGANPADFNPYVKTRNFGWINPSVVLDMDSSIEPIYKVAPNEVYQLNTKSGCDFFLIENVRNKGFFSSAYGEGLMIYHIGENIEKKAESNTINATFPQECYPVCASARSSYPLAGSQMSFGEINSAGCPFPGSTGETEFSIDSQPAAIDSQGEYIGISLVEIQEESDGCMMFRAVCEEQKGYGAACLWSETFDDMELSDMWRQELILGKGEWRIKKELSNIDGETSKGNDGFIVLQSVKSATSLNREPLAVRLESNTINIKTDADSLLLVFELKHEHKLFQKEDSMTLCVKDTKGVILASLQLVLTESMDWREFRIPFALTDEMLIVVESNIDARSKLYIDCMGVYEENEDYDYVEYNAMRKHPLLINGKIYELPKELTNSMRIYNTYGILVDSFNLEENEEVTLPVGVYIISDGCDFFKIKAY